MSVIPLSKREQSGDTRGACPACWTYCVDCSTPLRDIAAGADVEGFTADGGGDDGDGDAAVDDLPLPPGWTAHWIIDTYKDRKDREKEEPSHETSADEAFLSEPGSATDDDSNPPPRGWQFREGLPVEEGAGDLVREGTQQRVGYSNPAQGTVSFGRPPLLASQARADHEASMAVQLLFAFPLRRQIALWQDDAATLRAVESRVGSTLRHPLPHLEAKQLLSKFRINDPIDASLWFRLNDRSSTVGAPFLTPGLTAFLRTGTAFDFTATPGLMDDSWDPWNNAACALLDCAPII